AREESRLAFLRSGPDGGLFTWKTSEEAPRRLVSASPTMLEGVPAPSWPPGGRSIFFARRMAGLIGSNAPGGDQLELARVKTDTGEIESSTRLVHNKIQLDRPLLGAWLTFGGERGDFFYATASGGQEESKITWAVRQDVNLKGGFN